MKNSKLHNLTETADMELNTKGDDWKSSEEADKKTSICTIDRNMIRFKVHYFLFSGGIAFLMPYLPIIAGKKLGLSATALAAAITGQQFITVLSRIAIGYIADYFNKLKLIIMSLTILHTIFYALLLFIPPITELLPKLDIELIKDCNIEKETEFLIITSAPIQYCHNSSLGEDGFKSFFINNQSMYFVNNNNNYLACTEQLNDTALFCVQRQQDGQMIQCTTSDKPPKSTTNSSSENNYFYLSSLVGSLSRESVNRTLTCTFAFSEVEESSVPTPTINDFETATFWKFVSVYLAIGICYSSLFTLADTALCESMQKFGGDFGRQRIFAAIGYGALAPIGGLVCDFTNDYYAGWLLMAFLQALTVWNIYKLDLVKPHFSKNLLKDVGTVLSSSEFLVFELAAFMTGLAAGMVWSYLVWFITSLGGSKFLCGLLLYVRCFVGELPLMFYSGWIIKKVGHFNLCSLSLLAFAIRFLCYSYLQNPWLVLPIEVLQGVTYGTFYPAVASFGKLNAKPGTEATTQSILFTTHEGIGAGLGCVLAGVGFDHLGGHQTFFYASIFSFCALLVHLLNTLLIKKRQPKVKKWTAVPLSE